MGKNQSPHAEKPTDPLLQKTHLREYSHTGAPVPTFHRATHPSYVCRTIPPWAVNAVMISPTLQSCTLPTHRPELALHSIASFPLEALSTVVPVGL